MARLRREHHRPLGSGYRARPPELDCAFESIRESCTCFAVLAGRTIDLCHSPCTISGEVGTRSGRKRLPVWRPPAGADVTTGEE
jgi:hypothetical protein